MNNAHTDRRLRVAVIARTPRDRYSGGRYHALMLAQALASRGHDAFYLTDNDPIFRGDILDPHTSKAAVRTGRPITSAAPEGRFDVVVITPHQTPGEAFWRHARTFAKRRGARLALINFESPNWFNAISPFPRPESKWTNWRECTEDGCLVLCSALESRVHAEAWYTENPDRTLFDVWHPAINTLVADTIEPIERQRRIVVITRFDDQHKGASDLIGLLRPEFAGYTLVLLSGEAGSSPVIEELRDRAARCDMRISPKCRLSDRDKFIELRRAQLMVFPSYFEGFGYPPLEALYVGTPVVAYDLPVLRETCGDCCHFVPLGDIEALGNEALRLLRTKAWKSIDVSSVRDLMSFDRRAESIEAVLHRYTETTPAPVPAEGRPVSLLPRLRKLVRRRRVHLSEIRSLGRELSIRGWVYAPGGLDHIFAVLPDGRRVAADLLDRPDVRDRYPELPGGKLGFHAHFARGEASPTDEILVEASLSGGRRVSRRIRGVTLAQASAAESPPVQLGVSECMHDPESGEDTLRVWCFQEGRGVDRLEVTIGERHLTMDVNDFRPDVKSKFDACPSQLCGFRVRTTGLWPTGCKQVDVRFSAFSNDLFVGEVSRCPRISRPSRVPAKTMHYQRSGYLPAARPLVALVTHVIPLPETSGNRRVIAQCLRWLRRSGHDVLLVVQNHHRSIEPHVEGLLELCDRLDVVDPRRPLGTVPDGVSAIDLCCEETKSLLRTVHEKTPLTAVVMQYVHMARACERLPDHVHTSIMTHDILHRLSDQGDLIADWRRCTADEESDLLRRADTVVAITDHEQALLEQMVPDGDIITVGLAGEDCAVLGPSPETSRSLLFAASANPMNLDGIRWFTAAAWPLIHRALPDARLRIAGGICSLLDDVVPDPTGIDLLGVVEDLGAEIRTCAAILNCTRIGTGLKIKSIEAIAHGRALVSTANGVEGIASSDALVPYAEGRTDDPTALAEAVIRVLSDLPHRRDLEQRATAWAAEHLTEAAIYRPLAERLDAAATNQPPPPTANVRITPDSIDRIWPYVSHLLEATCRVRLTGPIGVAVGRDQAFAACCVRWLTRHGLNLTGLYGDTEGEIEGHQVMPWRRLAEHGVERLLVPTSDEAELGVIEHRVPGNEIDVLNFLGRPSARHRDRMHAVRDSHARETAFVLGNGPSVRVEDLDRLQGRFVLAANRFHLAYDRMTLRPTWTACADMLMMEQHGHQILECCQTPLFLQSRGAKHLALPQDEQIIEYDIIPRPDGPWPQVAFSDNCAEGLGNGASIVYDMIQLAVWAGAARVVVYGVDHSFATPADYDSARPGSSVQDTKEQNHFLPNYRGKHEHWYTPVTPVIEKGFEVALAHCAARGIALVNATRGGRLEILPRVDFDDEAGVSLSETHPMSGVGSP